MSKNQVTDYLHRDVLAQELHVLLKADQFSDYCHNGLQVAGQESVRRIMTAVTANIGAVEAAIAAGCDTLLVHHGWFWRGEKIPITGAKHKRLKLLLQADINLFCYHLPLDAHPTLGNNAAFAKLLDMDIAKHFGEQSLGCFANLAAAQTAESIAIQLQKFLQRQPLILGDATVIRKQKFTKIAWCTGAAQSLLADAIDCGAEIFISGEVSEAAAQLARDSDVVYIACGHHASERYGIQNLGTYIAKTYGISHQFVDIDSGV